MRRGLLVFVAPVLLVAAAVVVLTGPDPLRVPAGLLLLLLPGVLGVFALFPPSTIERAPRTMLTVGLSLSVAALAALALDVTVGLRRFTWVAVLVVIAVSTLLVAAARARGRYAASGPTIPRVRPRDLLLVLVGVALLGAAIGVMRTPLHAANVQGYTALWMVPVSGENAVRIGVESGELKSMSFQLVVRSRDGTIYYSSVPSLASGARVERVIAFPRSDHRGPERITAELFRVGTTRTPYRSTAVTLRAKA
jgi:hypothetical protein